jgi:hypothetical protein
MPVESSTPPSSEAAEGSAPSSPLGERDAASDEEEQPPPVALVYDLTPLCDLKTAQEHIMKNNLRPPLPRGLPEPVARLMELCWDENPEERPSFEIITDYLREQCGEMASLPLPLPIPSQHAHDEEDGVIVEASTAWA